MTSKEKLKEGFKILSCGRVRDLTGKCARVISKNLEKLLSNSVKVFFKQKGGRD